MHATFANAGEANRGKFARKLIICAFSLNELDKAKSIFSSMSKGAQDHVLTRYLMFKVALRCWDCDLGRQCIEHLSQSSEKSQTRDLLYACIREAQQVGDKLCSIASLKAVAETWTESDVSANNFPSVLRCTIRLIISIEEQEGSKENSSQVAQLTEDLCNTFERGKLLYFSPTSEY